MSENEGRNAHLVITALKHGLEEIEERWLLCLDNADNKEVGEILNEINVLACASEGNGWVVVTLRQGQPQIWGRMKSDQKLILEPLCVEDGMVALWRRSRVRETGDLNDDEVRRQMKKLELVNQAEYCARKKICGDDCGYGLGGLPLALVQAGSFAAQFECSFAEYLNLFESASMEDLPNIMNKTQELKSIRESQKSIWATWKISMQNLSRRACLVLRAMAMLGPGGIGEAIVIKVLKATTEDGGDDVKEIFRNVIVKELIHGSSLIWSEEAER